MDFKLDWILIASVSNTTIPVGKVVVASNISTKQIMLIANRPTVFEISKLLHQTRNIQLNLETNCVYLNRLPFPVTTAETSI